MVVTRLPPTRLSGYWFPSCQQFCSQVTCVIWAYLSSTEVQGCWHEDVVTSLIMNCFGVQEDCRCLILPSQWLHYASWVVGWTLLWTKLPGHITELPRSVPGQAWVWLYATGCTLMWYKIWHCIILGAGGVATKAWHQPQYTKWKFRCPSPCAGKEQPQRQSWVTHFPPDSQQCRCQSSGSRWNDCTSLRCASMYTM